MSAFVHRDMKHAGSLENTKDANFFSQRDLFADVMSLPNRNMKHAHAIEFD